MLQEFSRHFLLYSVLWGRRQETWVLPERLTNCILVVDGFCRRGLQGCSAGKEQMHTRIDGLSKNMCAMFTIPSSAFLSQLSAHVTAHPSRR